MKLGLLASAFILVVSQNAFAEAGPEQFIGKYLPIADRCALSDAKRVYIKKQGDVLSIDIYGEEARGGFVRIVSGEKLPVPGTNDVHGRVTMSVDTKITEGQLDTRMKYFSDETLIEDVQESWVLNAAEGTLTLKGNISVMNSSGDICVMKKAR